MKLPNCKNVIIPPEKLTDYLLSLTHPEGRSKAKFFRIICGFNETNVDLLELAMRKVASSRKIVSSRPSEDKSGINYHVNGKITIPNGGVRKIKTVWYMEKEQEKPRFVSAYPLK